MKQDNIEVKLDVKGKEQAFDPKTQQKYTRYPLKDKQGNIKAYLTCKQAN